MSAPPLPVPDKVLPAVLQKAQVRLLSPSECKKRFDPVTARMLCAGVPSGAQDACNVSPPSSVCHACIHTIQLIFMYSYPSIPHFGG